MKKTIFCQNYSVQPKTALHLFKEYDKEFAIFSAIFYRNFFIGICNFLMKIISLLIRIICNLFFKEKKKKKLTSDLIVYVEETTRNQSLCDSCNNVRVGRITGSILHQVFHVRVETPSVSLILNISVEKNIHIKSPAIKWRRENSGTINSVKEDIKFIKKN